MADAIEMLVDEHRLIERVLGSLDTFCERIGEEPEKDRKTVSDFVDFFHFFVDECHHGKEEGYLFVRMSAVGFSNEAGPVSAMLSEQGEGREHLSALKSIAEGSGPLTQHEQSVAKGHALGYITRILSHMKREDEILFPVTRHVLPAFMMDELSADFQKFNKQAVGMPPYEILLKTAGDLVKKYPPKQPPHSV